MSYLTKLMIITQAFVHVNSKSTGKNKTATGSELTDGYVIKLKPRSSVFKFRAVTKFDC